jgi:uncharacterized protein
MKHQPQSKAPKRRPLRQVAALPVRQGADGATEVLLVTSRGTGRWVLPKGHLMRVGEPASAAMEAWEEAGVAGRIDPVPIGAYEYDKTLSSGRVRRAVVTVYRLDVTEEREDWPERRQRQRQWLAPSTAATLVAEQELAALLAGAVD